MLLKAIDIKTGRLRWDITSRLQYKNWGEMANSSPCVTNRAGGQARHAGTLWWHHGQPSNVSRKEPRGTSMERKRGGCHDSAFLHTCALSSPCPCHDLTKCMRAKHIIITATTTLAFHAGYTWLLPASIRWLVVTSARRCMSLAACIVCYIRAAICHLPSALIL